MKLRIAVNVSGMYNTAGACMDIPELFLRHFEPMKTCDEPVLRMATDAISNEQAKVVMKTRKDAAEILSKALTDMIINEMKKNDTHNGYKESE